MDTSDYSFGYVLGWAGGAPDAIEGIKASTGRIQRAATAVLRTFEAEESIVEVANGPGREIGLSELTTDIATLEGQEHRHDVDAVLHDERLAKEIAEAESVRSIVDGSDGLVETTTIDLSSHNGLGSTYRPLSGAQLEVLDFPAEVGRELEVGRG
jgi:hypothetical protein